MGTEPVALIRDLPAGRVMRAQVGQQDIAVWRSVSGRLAAWGNRCPHRGMRLSHGFVRGEQLACLYHGWHYEGSGRCAYIPAHPGLEPPATIHATVFSASETGGIIWVSDDGPVAPMDMPDGLYPVRSLSFDAPETAVRAALGGGDPLQVQVPDGPRLTIVLGREPGGQIMAHCLADSDRPEAGITASAWLEQVRKQVEDAA